MDQEAVRRFLDPSCRAVALASFYPWAASIRQGSCPKRWAAARRGSKLRPGFIEEVEMAQIVGGCLCGQVRYTANADPAFTGVCHCTTCQKESGTVGGLVNMPPIVSPPAENC